MSNQSNRNLQANCLSMEPYQPAQPTIRHNFYQWGAITMYFEVTLRNCINPQATRPDRKLLKKVGETRLDYTVGANVTPASTVRQCFATGLENNDSLCQQVPQVLDKSSLRRSLNPILAHRYVPYAPWNKMWEAVQCTILRMTQTSADAQTRETATTPFDSRVVSFPQGWNGASGGSYTSVTAGPLEQDVFFVSTGTKVLNKSS